MLYLFPKDCFMAVSPAYRYTLSLADFAELLDLPVWQTRRKLGKDQITDLGGGRPAVEPPVVREKLEEKGFPFNKSVIAHINLKGGIGKTTTAITCATRAAQLGFRVVVLDLDSQASASVAFNLLPEDEAPVFYDLWSKPGEFLPRALKSIDPDLSILPSSLVNGLLDTALASPKHQKRAVRQVCDVLLESFDLVFIDCPPSLSTAVISSICAADHIVMPYSGDPFAFKGLELTFEEIEAIADTFQLAMPQIHLLFTGYDRRQNLHKKMEAKVQDTFAGEGRVIHAPIGVSTRYSKALDRHETIFASYRKNPQKTDYHTFFLRLLNWQE
jgi:chromosome partitioning protein